VPILFLRGGGCVAAWRALLGLMAANVGWFILYVLFRIVLDIVVGVLVSVVTLLLCCCCCVGCLLAVPFVGTVLRLPVLAFFRAYSAHYLAQYGPEWDVFAAAPRSNAA
jgi:hypothetical protein